MGITKLRFRLPLRKRRLDGSNCFLTKVMKEE